MHNLCQTDKYVIKTKKVSVCDKLTLEKYFYKLDYSAGSDEVVPADSGTTVGRVGMAVGSTAF